MVGKTAPIGRLDELRFKVITEYCGCLCCTMRHRLNAHATIEHVTENGRRLDDEHQGTIGLCEWHHFGNPWDGLTRDEMVRLLGPSLAHGRTPFEEAFGDEVEILLPLQDHAIALFAGMPWESYDMPEPVARRLQNEWKRLRRLRELSP